VSLVRSRAGISMPFARSIPSSWRGPGRTVMQSIASPVISTSLYFIVFARRSARA